MPRGDAESTYSLQGSIPAELKEYSPKASQRKQSAGVSAEDSRSTLEQPDASVISSAILDQMPQSFECAQKKPLAMVRPRQILSSITSSSDDYRRFYGNIDIDCCNSNLRECRSLDPFPSQLRRRLDCVKLSNLKLKNRSSHSLDACVSMISHDPNYTNSDSDTNRIIYNESEINDNDKKLVPYKHINNNCNGSVGTEDPNCPLLFRQGSLNNPHDDLLLHHKRWRSLETVGPLADEDTSSKKGLSRGSVRSWLVGLFQGNGLRSNDTSRRVGVMQSGVRGISGFGELPPAPEHESIV